MIGIIGFAKCTQMAARAFGRKSKTIELAYCTNLVTGVAVDGSVSSDQGKSILMFIDVMNGNLPAVRIVAELALRAVFAPMEICVAVLALYWCTAENEILVALGTLYFCVSATQGKLGPRVVEFDLGAQRLPPLRGVTLLALHS